MKDISHTHYKYLEMLPLSPEDEWTTTAPSCGYCAETTWYPLHFVNPRPLGYQLAFFRFLLHLDYRH